MEVHSKFKPMFRPKRIKVYFGGRSGMKTETFIRVALIKCMTDHWKFLGLRQHMNSIEDSIHAGVRGIIEDEGYQEHFDVRKTEIDGPHGSGFRYTQLGSNIGSIKSKYGFQAAIIEEAAEVTMDSLDTLEPTIRKGGSEIWYIFNPEREDDAVYQKYVLPHLNEILSNGFYEDDDIYVCKVGIEDNPWATPEERRTSELMKRDDIGKWLHVYGGEPKRDLDDVIIQPKWVEAAIDAHKRLKGFDPIGVKVLAFDPADTGDDAKAIAMRHGSIVFHVEQWKTGELNEAVNKAFDVADTNRMDDLVYDADGMGKGLSIGLEKRIKGKHLKVTPFNGGLKGKGLMNPEEKYDHRKNKDVFLNCRAQSIWLLRDRFEATYNAVEKGIFSDHDNLISLSSDIVDLTQLKNELTQSKRDWSNSSRIQIESKQKMKSRGVDSGNMADAVHMLWANSPIEAEIEKIEFSSPW